jgi:heme A synthase
MNRIAKLAWATLFFNMGVILWGAYVRATGSGAGCGAHWPLCNGQVLLREPALETIIEFTHRLTSGIALVMVALLVVRAYQLRPAAPALRRAAAASMIIILVEAALGAGLVLFQLVADNESMARALFRAVHLVNTFLLLGALTLTAHIAGGGAEVEWRGQGRTAWAIGIALAGVALSGASGAVAALGDTLYPARTLSEALTQDLSLTSELLIRLRVLHPALAIGTGLIVIAAARHAAAVRPGARSRQLATWLTAVVVFQLVLGFVNVLLLAPVWLQLVHLLVADTIWILLVLLGAQALARTEPAFAAATRLAHTTT